MAFFLSSVSSSSKWQVRQLASLALCMKNAKGQFPPGRRPAYLAKASAVESAAILEAANAKHSSKAKGNAKAKAPTAAFGRRPGRPKKSHAAESSPNSPAFVAAFAAKSAAKGAAAAAAAATAAKTPAPAASPKAAAAAGPAVLRHPAAAAVAATAAAATAVITGRAVVARAATNTQVPTPSPSPSPLPSETSAGSSSASAASRFLDTTLPDGLRWYPNSEPLRSSEPRPGVIVAKPVEYMRAGKLEEARQYAAFRTYQDYRNFIDFHRYRGSFQGLHEVIPEVAPRCLYFDLDGGPHWRVAHDDLVKYLRAYLLDFFGAEQMGWPSEALFPVLLRSADPTKFSCHVLFPEVQFENFDHQQQYVSPILAGLGALVLDCGQEKPLPLLKFVVDRVPYMRFQHFRGPFACKPKAGKWRPETALEVEQGAYFRDDPLTCFAGYVNPEYALPLRPVDELIDNNKELKVQLEQNSRSSEFFGMGSDMDTALFDPDFFTSNAGELDLLGLPEIEQYEVCLKLIHRARASQWASWFRLSGVCFQMMQRHGNSPEMRHRILHAHMTWSQGYADFDEDENWHLIEKAAGKRVSGLSLLKKMLIHDNPYMTIRM
mmetsp:Transcript_94485/g.197392  ORF Transcript_94485/g.197392 Transcript_94485/m.197392 type:complete len:604 (-) Transcript_94485:218-2029(-)